MSHRIRIKKELGQNFLRDPIAIERIASAIDISGKNIVEVGPGYGALTDTILQKNPHHLTLVEFDADLIPILEKKYQNVKNLTICHQDVLTFYADKIPYSVIANIPYYITSSILFHFLDISVSRPEYLVIMMQREVGEKILGGTKKKKTQSILSLMLGYYSDRIEPLMHVPRESFFPIPKVDSIVLVFHVRTSLDHHEKDLLFPLWESAFRQPRKTLATNLRSSQYADLPIIPFFMRLGYSPSVRAEEIEASDWYLLVREIEENRDF